MRISAGISKGRLIQVPKVPGIRVTQEKARQAVFSILGDKILGASCLDLFAGSGSIGLEALSRGAESCDFVDINPESAKVIKKNLQVSGLEQKAQVFRDDSLKFVANAHRTYELIFLDPYYDQAIHRHLFKVLPQILEDEGALIFFHGVDLDAKHAVEGTPLHLADERRYGATVVSIFQKNKVVYPQKVI